MHVIICEHLIWFLPLQLFSSCCCLKR